MSAEKTEALRLAAELDAEIQRTVQLDMMHHNAAVELRRLQEDNEALKRRVEALNQALRQWLDKTEWIQETGRGSELGLHRADAARQRLVRAEAQRDALLEALKDMLNAENTYPYGGMSESEIAAIQKARAAIKAVEEEA